MEEITLGQYYPENSIIHKLDPRVKLFGTLIFIIAIFSTNNIIGLLAIVMFLAIIIKISKVPFAKIIKGIKGILFLLVFTIVLNILFTPGTPIITFWIIKITKEGLITGGFLTFRLTFLVLSTSVLTLTTTPNDLSDGLEKSFAFLNKIHFPVHEMAMMMSLALRFIPTLVEETEKIKKAQMARGADFETGGLMQRVKSLIPLLVPLFVSSIRRALDLAMAMEARCYHGGNRTKLKPLVYKKKDKISYLVLVGFLCVILGAGFVTNNLVMFKFLSIKAS